MPDPSTPAFVIGVTGHMDLPEEDIPLVEERLRVLYRWLRTGSDHPPADCPNWWPRIEGKQETGEALTGLGLDRERIILLTSLAPGVDTLAAKVALEPEFGIEVRAPLPFPKEIYPRSSTFADAEDPRGATETFESLVAEGSGIDAFPVLTSSDLELDESGRESTFEADLENEEGRNLRYRAAGEYVGTHSHLLFAFFQPDVAGQTSGAGSQTILDVSRTGPTAGILPMANHFPWNDAVPVVYVPCRSKKRLGNLSVHDDWREIQGEFLPPFWLDACAVTGEEEMDADCARIGIETLQETAARLREYVENIGGQGPDHSREHYEAARGFLFGIEEAELAQADRLSSKGRDFLASLGPMVLAQERGSQLASGLEKRRRNLMRRMALFTLVAAVAFHCFSHWNIGVAVKKSPDPSPAPYIVGQAKGAGGEAAEADIKKGKSGDAGQSDSDGYAAKSKKEEMAIRFLTVTIVFIGLMLIAYHIYDRWGREKMRFDSRAVSEGLRIQFYWSVSGTLSSVAERYMHRQKGELDWIRNAISSLSFPYVRWRDGFRSLDESDQQILIGGVMRNWVGGQVNFFSTKGKIHAHRLHRHHVFGWGMTLAAILQVVVLCLYKLTGRSDLLLPVGIAMLAVYGVWLLVSFVRSLGHHHEHGSSKGKSIGQRLVRVVGSVFDFLILPGEKAFAIGASGLLMLLVNYSAYHPGLPVHKDAWIIVIGAALVSGAISIAWGEKLLLAEQSRQYRAMHDLFRNALAHLEARMAEWQGSVTGDPMSQGTPLEEIQETLVDLGKEALDENAEWLVLHRARPFEPFLAG